MKKVDRNKSLMSGIILSVIFFVIGLCIPGVSNDNNKLIVVEELQVSSSVQNVFLQEYSTIITGVIKNISEEDILNIKLELNVQTSIMNDKGKLEYDIGLIKANSEYIVNLQFKTNKNYESIDNIYVIMDDGTTIKLNNDIYNNIIKTVLIIVSIISFVTCIAIIFYNKKKQLMQQNNVTLTDEEEIEQLQNKIKKVELKSMLKALEKINICPYCGTENDFQNKKCDNCGAIIK